MISFFFENYVFEALIASVTIVLIRTMPFAIRCFLARVPLFSGVIFSGFSCTVAPLDVIINQATGSVVMGTFGDNEFRLNCNEWVLFCLQ